MAKTIVIFGFGPGISTGVAEKFGAEGFQVALVGRTRARLETGVAALAAKGITAASFVADAGKPAEIVAALAAVKAQLGPVTAIHWNAIGGTEAPDLLAANPAALSAVFDVAVVGLLTAVRSCLPDLKAAGDGAVLITNGGFGDLNAQVDAYAVGSRNAGVALANGAKQKLVGLLVQQLKAEGIHVAQITIAGSIKGTSWEGPNPIAPSTVGDRFFELYSGRSESYGPPVIKSAWERTAITFVRSPLGVRQQTPYRRSAAGPEPAARRDDTGADLDMSFAFQPGALDRAAHLRASDTAHRDPRATTLVFWRGKLLLGDAGQPLRIPLDHPALKDCRDAPLLLGLGDDGPRFAADLALFQPHEDAATVGQFTDQSLQVHPAFPGAHFGEIRGVMASLSPLDGECVAVGRALQGWHGTHRFCANCGAPSVVELSGWQRKCPTCATQHFPRTDPVVIMAITHGDRLLLGRGPSWPERMYSLLAGFVEPGETIEAAVRRETLEESAVRVGPVSYVANQPWPFPMSLMFGCHGEALTEAITIDPVELADARWVSRDEVRAILSGEHPGIAVPRKGAIAGALITAWANGTLLTPGTFPR